MKNIIILLLSLTLIFSSCLPITQDDTTPQTTSLLVKKYDRITAIYNPNTDEPIDLDYPYYFINGSFETIERVDIVISLASYGIQMELYENTGNIQLDFISFPQIEEIQVDRNGVILLLRLN